MKIRVITTALLCFAAGSVLAEPPGPPPGGPERNIERLAILLDLDAGQKVAVQKVFDEQRAEMTALRTQAKASDERPTREQMRAKHEEMKKQTHDKLAGVLSDTQLKKFEVLTERPDGPRPGKRGDRGERGDDTRGDKAK